jgi:hypothetical protein
MTVRRNDETSVPHPTNYRPLIQAVFDGWLLASVGGGGASISRPAGAPDRSSRA